MQKPPAVLSDLLRPSPLHEGAPLTEHEAAALLLFVEITKHAGPDEAVRIYTGIAKLAREAWSKFPRPKSPPPKKRKGPHNLTDDMLLLSTWELWTLHTNENKTEFARWFQKEGGLGAHVAVGSIVRRLDRILAKTTTRQDK